MAGPDTSKEFLIACFAREAIRRGVNSIMTPGKSTETYRECGLRMFGEGFADVLLAETSKHRRAAQSKAEYVRTQGQNREHHCHWPGCKKQVPPAVWGCKPHWFALPKAIRDRIWATYRKGQEIDGRPSADYIAAAKEAQRYALSTMQRAPGAGQAGLF